MTCFQNSWRFARVQEDSQSSHAKEAPKTVKNAHEVLDSDPFASFLGRNNPVQRLEREWLVAIAHCSALQMRYHRVIYWPEGVMRTACSEELFSILCLTCRILLLGFDHRVSHLWPRSMTVDALNASFLSG
jgi:hypothetical protein